MVSVADYGPMGPWFESWPGRPTDIVSRPDNMDETVLHTYLMLHLIVVLPWP